MPVIRRTISQQAIRTSARGRRGPCPAARAVPPRQAPVPSGPSSRCRRAGDCAEWQEGRHGGTATTGQEWNPCRERRTRASRRRRVQVESALADQFADQDRDRPFVQEKITVGVSCCQDRAIEASPPHRSATTFPATRMWSAPPCPWERGFRQTSRPAVRTQRRHCRPAGTGSLAGKSATHSRSIYLSERQIWRSRCSATAPDCPN